MPKDFSRSARVVEQIKRELAELIRLEVKDPRIGFITITDVEITPDYAHAKVFFSSFKGKDAADEAIKGLRSASAFLRRELGRRVRIHTTPELHFHYDNSIEEGTRLSAIIDKAMEDTAPADDEGTEGDKPA